MHLHNNKLCKIIFYGLSFIILSACASTKEPLLSRGLGNNPYAKLYDGKAETVFSTLLPPATALEAIKLGDNAVATGNEDEALFRYVQALYIDDSYSTIFLKIGEIHASRSSYDLAKIAYIQALLRQENNTQAMESLGIVQIKLQEYSVAKEVLEKARSIRPQSWRTLNALGMLADINKKYLEAKTLYEQAIKIRPNLPEIQINFGYSRYLAGNYKQAIDVFNNVLAQDPNQKRAWMNLGLAYFKLDQHKNAVKAFSQAVSLVDAYNNVGYLLFLEAKRTPHAEQSDHTIQLARNYYNLAIKQSFRYHAEAEENLQILEEWVRTEL